MKQRLIVMNGYRILQSQHAREWKTDRVDKAREIKPGIYNLYLSVPSDKTKVHKGVVLHIEEELIIQQSGKACVRHDRVALRMLPEDGIPTTICYENERALVISSHTRARREKS